MARIKKVKNFLPISIEHQLVDLKDAHEKTLRGNSASLRYSGLVTLSFCQKRTQSIEKFEAGLYFTQKEMTACSIAKEAQKMGIYKEFTSGQALVAINEVLIREKTYRRLMLFIKKEEGLVLQEVFKKITNRPGKMKSLLDCCSGPVCLSFNPEEDIFATSFAIRTKGKYRPMYLIF